MPRDIEYIDVKDIQGGFGNGHPPKDDLFIDLYSQAMAGKIPLYEAVIKIDGITPFSDFKPNTDNEFEEACIEDITMKNPPKIFLYQKGETFIMSDDYNAFYTYKKLGFLEVPCIIMGNFNSISVTNAVKLVPNPLIDESLSAHDNILKVTGYNLPITGGRGRSIKDAIVINKMPYEDGIQMEYMIVDILCKLSNDSWELVKTELLENRGRKYEKLKIEVESDPNRYHNFYFDVSNLEYPK